MAKGKTKSAPLVSQQSQTPAVTAPTVLPSRRPTLADLATVTTVEIRTVQPRSVPIVVAGVLVTPTPREYAVADIRALGPSFIQALAESDEIIVKVVK